MAKFRYTTTTLDFTIGIGAPSFPVREGLSLHTYITGKPFYTITNREHGTTQINWTTNGVQQTLRDTIEDFWNTTLSEGYNDFTVVDNRLRMLFEASWNDWAEQWMRRKGCTYDISYLRESPIPWTLPTYGIYPMSANDLINHNLNGDDLSATDGVLTTNATDSTVLRLNGSALKMEGDGSSSGLLGASATVDWSRTTKNNNISLFCQFMADNVLSTGSLAILEVTHSNNVFRIGLKPSGVGGVLTFVEAFDAGNDTIHCVLDSDYKVGFSSIGNAFTQHLRTYNYTTDADFTFSVASAQNGVGQQIAIDTTLMPRLVFAGYQNNGVTLHSYNDSAVLIHIQTLSATFARGITLDTGRGFLFVGESHNGGPTLESYPYTGVGVGAQIDATPNDANQATWLSIDTILKRVFLIHSNGADMYSYDDSGDNLTYIDNADAFSSALLNGSTVDTTRNLFFHCSDSGLHLYGYSLIAFTAALSSVTDKDFVSIDIDTVNRFVYATTKASGVFVYKYAADGTSLTPLSSDDQGGVYYGCSLDATNNILATVKQGGGLYSYSVGADINQLFGKIVNNADSAEIRKGASSYHELTNSTWYDLGFTYDAITQKSFLYFAASGTASGFTNFLDGETDITEGIGEENNTDAKPQDVAWTGVNLLKELTNDVVADGSNVYIQNPMVFDGRMSEHDFNTMRRLTHLWNQKTTVYPK